MSTAGPAGAAAAPGDRAVVAELLGREPRGAFEVVVRAVDGRPVVIRNAPLLDDGTPMPTSYWLLDPELNRRVGTLEAAGGVRRAEAEIDADEVAAAHARYGAERDARLPSGHTGPRPSGGVGGTRRGLKCLHAHYAWFLAGGDDPVGRWVHDRLYGPPVADPEGQDDPMSDLVAAIDCGTNSVRLLVSDGGRPVERLMRITRLGQGVDRTGRLDPAAIDRTLEVLREYRSVMDRHGVQRVRMATTSASRDAANRDEFFDAAEEILGTRPELLSGTEEAELSFRGATAELDPLDGPFLVVDIGGGSTEFAVGSTSLDGSISVDMGCVRMTEKHLEHDPPLPEELSNCLAEVEQHLDDVLRALPRAAACNRLVGLAGTITTAAAVEQGLVEHDHDRVHHFVLEKDAAEDVFRTLATESLADRRHNPGLEEARADVIVGGMCVLVQILRTLGYPEVLVSEADILDGLVMSQLG